MEKHVVLGKKSIVEESGQDQTARQDQPALRNQAKAHALPAGGPGYQIEWLLDRAKSTREGDWKPTTKSVNQINLRVLRSELGDIPVHQFGTIELH